ncbi:Methyltransferase domain protein [Pseudodesulfovibrio hydrargyri]|uniref:Methyltransferase domain protein n=1 Tax=Pseudodesulfovibrio hydrargyri TaxID=2125990 RepID=A0A1J5MTA9_9BACT|nr:methyltransferase domain-containing protein [Pseudodesulfovibrio hydrargyri]OIQ49242.1 Methyltransferase domain protein [Pseudodesulfovibrio hydrargyri]
MLRQYKELHSESKGYGTSSLAFFDEVCDIIKNKKVASVLDYGCGKGLLSDALAKEFPDIVFYRYDPGMQTFRELPKDKVDLVICTDVIEHVPGEKIDDFLQTVSSFSQDAYFNISCRLATKLLKNGENAHCSVYPPRWWHAKLKQFYKRVIEIPTNDLTAGAFVTFEYESKMSLEEENAPVLYIPEKKNLY